MVEDASTNKSPEADSLSYIRLLLESLHNLGHLPNAIATVNQRLPVELFKLVDKTNTEVDQRHPSSLTGVTRGYRGKTVDLGLKDNDVRVTIIHDLLCTLYSKFEAVMEGYRIIYDVVKGITKRGDSLQEAETWKHGFVEVWQLVQSEVLARPSTSESLLTGVDAIIITRLLDPERQSQCSAYRTEGSTQCD